MDGGALALPLLSPATPNINSMPITLQGDQRVATDEKMATFMFPHGAMGSLQGAWKLSWNLTSGPQQRADMKLGYLRVCSRASDNPGFICIGMLCSVSQPLPWLLCWLLAWLLARCCWPDVVGLVLLAWLKKRGARKTTALKSHASVAFSGGKH